MYFCIQTAKENSSPNFFLYPEWSGYVILLYIYKDFGVTWCLCLHRGRPKVGLDALPQPYWYIIYKETNVFDFEQSE